MEDWCGRQYKFALFVVALLASSQLTAAWNGVLDDEKAKDSGLGVPWGKEIASSDREGDGLGGLPSGPDSVHKWDEFGDTRDLKDEELDPGSWRHALDQKQAEGGSPKVDLQYCKGTRKTVDGLRDGDPALLAEASSEFTFLADRGHPQAQFMLDFIHGSGCGMNKGDVKAHVCFQFSAKGVNSQSKMPSGDGKAKASGESQGKELASSDTGRDGLGSLPSGPDSVHEWDEFGNTRDLKDEELDPGSWREALDQEQAEGGSHRDEVQYCKDVKKMVDGFGDGNPALLAEAISDLTVLADHGHAHAQSTLGFLHGSGYGMDKSDVKAHLLHHFAAEGGNFQSKMALAYSYYRKQINEKAIGLYAELALAAMTSFRSTKEEEARSLDPVRLYDGYKESKELKKFLDFQFLQYKAREGFPVAMYRLGLIYYLGLRGVPRDHMKALTWFLRAVEEGDYESMELLGEIYAWGFRVERNYTRAMEWFVEAAKHKQHSAYNGIWWLFAKGLGVEKKNLTKAREYFKSAADARDPDGLYNMGVLYLQGLGVQKDVKEARRHFLLAVNTSKLRHLKALYQLAKMHEKGIVGKKHIATAVELYKLVAERGPSRSLLEWALECYLKREVGKALLLYSRAAELGYEVAQSNAAWILDKYYNEDVCIGSHGFCTDAERQQLALALWRYASNQGNQHAFLSVGDAYYYGRGTERDLALAAEAYNGARLQSSSQAMFNLGYMYEHDMGLPMDLRLAKRHYDEALEIDHDAALIVTWARMRLWLRQHYANRFPVRLINAIPDAGPNTFDILKLVSFDTATATLITLSVCLVIVLYLRQRQRRAAAEQPQRVEPPGAH